MKKFLLLGMMALMALSLAVGCVREVETYIDSGQTIDIGTVQEFVIAIGANPTTGHAWEVTFNETMLELVEKTYKPAKESEYERVGAGGVYYFRFRALKEGEVEIVMVYKRPWEEEVIYRKVFTVNID